MFNVQPPCRKLGMLEHGSNPRERQEDPRGSKVNLPNYLVSFQATDLNHKIIVKFQ